MHKLTTDKFLALNRPWAQAHANAGRESLNLYRDPTGKARLLLQGWPAPKSWHFLATAVPAPNTPKGYTPQARPHTTSA